MVAALTIAALCLMDRKAAWLGRLNWVWGLIILAAICGPWAWAVTVATDGGFWSAALGGDLAPKLAGGQETHGAPPGYHTLLSPILMFPMTLMLPAAAVTAWKRWREPGVRFAIAWLVPTWLVFEALPTKLVHYTLPAYGAVAMLAAAALIEPIGKRTRWTGAVLASVFGLLLAFGTFYLVKAYGDLSDLPFAIPTAILLAAAGLVGGYLLIYRAPPRAVVAAVGLGLAGHAALAAGLAPRLNPLWLSARVERVMAKSQLLPEQGIADAPVTVAGYAEPSLVFALGTPTELAGPEDAAQAIYEHRPAVVELRQEAAFEKALAVYRARTHLVGTVKGLDYSDGKKMTLNIYEAAVRARPRRPINDPQDRDRRSRPARRAAERKGPAARSTRSSTSSTGWRPPARGASRPSPSSTPSACRRWPAPSRSPKPCRTPPAVRASAWCSMSAAGTAASPPAATRPMWWSAPPTASASVTRAPRPPNRPPPCRPSPPASTQKGGPPITVTVSVAFGCPFDGEVSEEQVMRIVRAAAESGVAEIALADTIGVADPWLVRKRVEAAKTAAPGIPLRMHFHDTRNTGLANAYASVEAGVDVLDASCGGLGGCPFAPDATGNIGTEDLVYMLERAGFETGYDLPALIDTAKWMAQILGKPPAASVSRAGVFPMATSVA